MGKQLARIASVFWGQVIVALAAFAGIRTYTELMDKVDFGQAMLLAGLIALLDSIILMSLNQTLMSRCGPVECKETRRHISIGLALYVVRMVLVVIPVACLAVMAGLNSFWALLLLSVGIYLISEALKFSALSLIVLDRRYGIYSFWTAGEALITLAGISLSLWFWRADAIGFVLGQTAARAVNTALFMLLLAPGHLRSVDLKLAQKELAPALAYGRPVALMGPLGWISTYLDRYILGAFLGTGATGAYVAVTGLVARPFALTTSVLSNYFRPLYFQGSLASEGAKGCYRILRTWLLAALGIGLMGVLAFWVLGDFIVRIMLAADFREGAHLLLVLFGLSQTFAIATHAADNAMLALRCSGRLLQIQILLSIGTLVLIPVGIVSWGLVGGVIGRIFAEALKLGVTTAIAVRLIKKMDGMAGVLDVDTAEGEEK
ncbi:lipopolysaccharide biosynthesis protein [Phaeobacter sp. B1627]|uniref:lipopolysaccharide biosynthesis protein n=1 Tax=Phaeobacter sp. B1627 TaxID=2583809 RepID=UPI00159EBD8F|nr:oligosaccharide flippase family protein [Phaeobacter sp. B1627]